MTLPLLSFKMLANTAFSWRNQHPKHSRSPSKGSSFPGRQIVEGNPPTGSELHVKPKNKIMGAAWAFNAIKVLYGSFWTIFVLFVISASFGNLLLRFMKSGSQGKKIKINRRVEGTGPFYIRFFPHNND